jgi:ferrochelatase
MSQPFDAVLVIAFGGPQGQKDVGPFLANVLRGRTVPPERVDEVARHYERFGGVSPLTELTHRQAGGLRERLLHAGVPLPVFVGMRNWHPFLRDTLAAMSRAGIRRAIGFVAAAHRSYSSCAQYRENVAQGRAELARARLRDVEVTYVGDWHTHARFVAANASRVREALMSLPEPLQREARLVFTAHSIPLAMADRYPYREQIAETARLVADQVFHAQGAAPGTGQTDPTPHALDYAIVYQSRSGRPEDPWLEPDICSYLRAEHARGLRAAVVCPIGFIADHVEVLYDLDVDAAAVCREIGLPMARARTVNDHPQFLDMMADVVLQTIRRYRSTRPLQLIPA